VNASDSGITFTWRAADAEGVERSGQLQAADEPQALRELLRQGLMPLAVTAAPRAGAVASANAPRRAASVPERITLLQELATLLGAGISLAEALPSLAASHATLATGAALAAADRAVRGGQRLSVALREGPLALPPYVLALVEAGEASGELATALRDAATQMDYERRAAQELKSALIYPAVLVSAGVVAVSIIFIGVVPRFASLLKSTRADVPALSRAVIEAGLFVQQNLLAFGLGAALLAALVAAALSSPELRGRALEVAARLPLVGPWLLRVEVGRWATVLGTLLANRVPIIEAINLSAAALQLDGPRRDLATVAAELQRGRALADVLATRAWFPRTGLNLVRVGERSGDLPRMLATLGTVETEAARMLQKRLLTLIEPAAIIVIGAVIGLIMTAVMMAITSLNTVNF